MASVAVGDFLSEYDEDAPAARTRGDQAAALRGPDPRPGPPVSQLGPEGRPDRSGSRQSGRGAPSQSRSPALPARARPCRSYGRQRRARCIRPRAPLWRAHRQRLDAPPRSRPPARGRTTWTRSNAVPSMRRATDVGTAPGAGSPAPDTRGRRNRSGCRAPWCTVCCKRLERRQIRSLEDAGGGRCVLRPDEAAGLADRATRLRRVRRPSISGCAVIPTFELVLRASDILHEVPFDRRSDGVSCGGSIDCLVRRGRTP